jgi:prepilin-type N-terminal cleavage/methylation domain-containing protein
VSTRRTSRRDAGGDAGFTLVEVLVALGLITVILAAALPVFVSMLKATTTTKLQTQAKNLSQQRLDQMRNLRFHVDRQNGPFLDLLDMYYTNAISTSPTTTVTVAGIPLVGKYIASAAAANGHPAGPFYQVKTGTLPAPYQQFSQTIDTQFLNTAGTPLGSAVFQDKYNSQTVGADQSPTLIVGVTIITSWTQNGVAKANRIYTRITDGRPQLPVIQSQGRATAVQISSTAVNGSTLQLQGGVATVDGAQSSGSSVAGYATGVVVVDGSTTSTGLVSQYNLPAQAVTTAGSGSPQTSNGCAWYGYGSNGVSNVDGDISAGLPKGPSNVDAASPANVFSGYLQDIGSPTCGQLSFDSLAHGGIARSDGLGVLMGAAPFVKIRDSASNAQSVVGSVYASATALNATPQQTTAGASVKMTKPVVIFPNTTEPMSAVDTGLVKVQVLSASVDCVSGTTATVTGKYQVVLSWFGKAPSDSVSRWHARTFNYNSAVSPTPTVAAGSDAWDPVNTQLSSGARLSDLVTVSLNASGLPSIVSEGAQTGLRGFPNGVLTLTTASTQANEPLLSNGQPSGFSAVTVVVGKVTCVADDRR